MYSLKVDQHKRCQNTFKIKDTDPAITLLVISYTEEYKNANSKGYMHPNIYSSIIKNSQIMEAVQMSINWMH